MMRGVHDEDVGPLHQPLQNLLSSRRFQIERHAALVSVIKMKLIRLLGLGLWRNVISKSPWIAGRRLYFDDVSAEVRENHSGRRGGDKAPASPSLQAGK